MKNNFWACGWSCVRFVIDIHRCTILSLRIWRNWKSHDHRMPKDCTKQKTTNFKLIIIFPTFSTQTLNHFDEIEKKRYVLFYSIIILNSIFSCFLMLSFFVARFLIQSNIQNIDLKKKDAKKFTRKLTHKIYEKRRREMVFIINV